MGNLFFTQEHMHFFNADIGDTTYEGVGGVYFVTSEQFQGPAGDVHPRRFTVRQWAHEWGDILTAGLFYDIKEALYAVQAAQHLCSESLERQTNRLLSLFTTRAELGKYQDGVCGDIGRIVEKGWCAPCGGRIELVFGETRLGHRCVTGIEFVDKQPEDASDTLILKAELRRICNAYLSGAAT